MCHVRVSAARPGSNGGRGLTVAAFVLGRHLVDIGFAKGC